MKKTKQINNRNRILHICMAQYSDGWSYQENLLAKYHKKLGFDVIVLTSMFCYKEGNLVKDTKESFVDINGVHVIRLSTKTNGAFGKLPIYNDFYKTLLELKPDIIFSHGCQYVNIADVYNYVNKYDVKLYIDNHADFSNSATNFFSKQILHKIIWKHYAQQGMPYTRKYWGVMPSRVDFLSEVYKIPKNRIDLLVMGADDELVDKSKNSKINIDLRTKYNIKNSDFLIVTGGKIDLAKKQTILLMKAVRNISNEDVKLLVFGSIDDKLKGQVDDLIDNNKVLFAGWVSQEESYDFFSVADLVCFPGRHSVFWEQVVGQGKPLLVKDWKGTHHVNVCDNVVFIENDSVEIIQDLIIQLYSDQDLFEKIKKNAEKAKKTFSYTEIAKKSIEMDVKYENKD